MHRDGPKKILSGGVKTLQGRSNFKIPLKVGYFTYILENFLILRGVMTPPDLPFRPPLNISGFKKFLFTN